MSQAHAAAIAPQAPAERIDWPRIYLGFAGLAIGNFMAILDIQIVTAAMAEIQAGVGATADEIGWIQSIYLLAEVITVPLCAYLSNLWSTRNFYLGATVAFLVTSVLVGMSNTIDEMIVARALQGLAAGAMIPPAFSAAMILFPPDKRIMANVIMSVIVSLAPTIGPTLGGHLAEVMSWRWLFFINVPPGLVVLFMVARWGGIDKPNPELAKGVDWWGVLAMAVFLLSMQWVLEEGAEHGWLEDDIILGLSVIAPISGALFVWRQLTYRQPIVSLAVFRDRNFALGALVSMISGANLFGGVFILPLYLAHVGGYSSGYIGQVMLVAGATMLVVSPPLGTIVRKFGFRLPLVIGLLLVAVGMWQGTHVTAEWGIWEFAGMQVLRSVGAMLAMLGGTQMAISTLPVSQMKEASGLLTLLRNIGGAMGLAAISTMLTQQTAEHYQLLTAKVNLASLRAQEFLAMLTARMESLGVADPEGAARKAMSHMLHREASVLAYADAFAVLTVTCVVGAVIGFFAAPAKPRVLDGPAH